MGIIEKAHIIQTRLGDIKTIVGLPSSASLEDVVVAVGEQVNNAGGDGSTENEYFIPGVVTGRSGKWYYLVNKIPPIALGEWTNMTSFFEGYRGDELVVEFTDNAKPKTFHYWFSNIQVKKLDVSKIDTSAVTSMNYAFQGAECPVIDISKWDTNAVQTCNNMFYNIGYQHSDPAQRILPIIIMGDNFGPNVTSAQYMFYTTFIDKIDLPGLRLPKCSNMYSMFSQIRYITEINIPNLVSDGAPMINDMFEDTAFTKLDIRSFDFTKVSQWTSAFTTQHAESLIIVKDQTQKDWLATNFSFLTNVQTVAEYEGVVEEPAEMSEQDIINYIADNQYSSTIDGVGSYKYFASTHGLYDRVIFYNEDGSLCDFFYDLYPCDSEDAAAAKALEDQSNVGMYSITWVGAAGTKVYWKTTTSDQDKTKTIDEWIDSYSFVFTEKTN